MLSTNLQWEKTDVWTLSNYQSVLPDMMAACAYMNSETLFFECFRERFFHTYCSYDNLRYRFNALWCWIFVTVKIILKSGVETFSQKSHIQQKYINKFDYCIETIQKSKLLIYDKIRIYFMSFLVQISSFVHLFTFKIVFRWGVKSPPWTFHQGIEPWTCRGP
jgi:hypothetical protein